MAVAAAGFTPSARRVEGEVVGVERFEGFAGSGRDAGSREGFEI